MDEYVIKQKIQKACLEPRAPEGLIQKVALRSRAVVLGAEAQKQLENAPAEKVAALASLALVGQLAAVSELPAGVRPEQLAGKLAQEPAFVAALRGGNIARRLSSGELMQQVIGKKSAIEPSYSQKSAAQKNGPAIR